ncbi:MAG: methyltransferase domain-containing protein [bacterium]|nr:methyltransferase domain-containing protein [bacterium]MDE0353999.1 methyltransferase domain-containing protein [bacterium]
MSFKLSNALKRSTTGIARTVSEYEKRFRTTRRGNRARTALDHKEVNDLYYDVVTDFFEFGWGRSFHFAPRGPGESFNASLARHQHYLAHKLRLGPGMVVADLGCGVGGPLLEIAQFTGARIVGVNSNAYQLEHARKYAEEAELTHLAEFMHCDFLEVDAPDGSFDAVFSIEATCHAPDKVSIYGEAFRLLKPGACFASYEWCMTDRYDPEDPLHRRIKADIELGGGILELDERRTVDEALVAVGFEVLETRDVMVPTGPSVPWYQPLAGSGISLATFRSSRIGRSVTQATLRLLEALRIAPKGSVRVSETLNLCAVALVEAGRLGIFTPAYFIHARKPE